MTPFGDRSTLWLVAGLVMLGWTMARMTIRRKKRGILAGREDREVSRRLAAKTTTASPLGDAPVETQRWQIAMFDLQREVTAEMDTRIATLNRLIVQADERIAELRRRPSIPAGDQSDRDAGHAGPPAG